MAEFDVKAAEDLERKYDSGLQTRTQTRSWNGSFIFFPFFSQATIISLRALERPSIIGIWVSICPGSSCWFSSATQSSNQTAL